MKKQKILVTGAAGFIGFHVSKKLSELNFEVVGIDNLNDYYCVDLKLSRLDILKESDNFNFIKMDITEDAELNDLFKEESFDKVIHLAAQAGVRNSIDNPMDYLNANLKGHLNILECCRNYPVDHLLYASSSSVYGLNEKTPFNTSDNVDHPASLYAATKKSNELMAHSYSHLYKIPTTGLRFFTVYGPWGRPDMALFKFTQSIFDGKEIDIYNNGKMMRDFTYVDDIVEGIIRLLDKSPKENIYWSEAINGNSESSACYKIFNIGNGNPVKLMDFVDSLESATGVKALKNFMPMQKGDVYATYADTKNLEDEIDFTPQVSVNEGVENFVCWYKDYYKIK